MTSRRPSWLGYVWANYCCVTTTFFAATLTVTLRPAAAFAATFTVAKPVPILPPLTVAQEIGDDCDQPHADVVVTVTVLDPPAFVKLSDVGDTV